MKGILIVALHLTSMAALAQDTTRISLLFAGDIMGHDSQITDAYDPASQEYNYLPCFQYIRPLIESVDVAIGNLEVTLAGKPFKGYPQFSSPDELAVALKEIGFDALVTANNHSVDRGKQGIERTIAVLDSLQIHHTGTFVGETDRLNNYPLMLEAKGFRFALLNYTYGTNGIPVPSPTIVNRLDTAQMRKDIETAHSRKPDFIIAFLHWGVEYESLPRKQQKDVAEFCLSLGVNAVIGAHPHVIQPMEWRKDSSQAIVYSLGNFVSGQRKRYTDGGATAYMSFQKIAFSPDSSTTQIDSVGYNLQWVYRTADVKKDYYVLPLPLAEQDTTGIIRDEASRQAMRLFADDSRLLYGKHNVNVREVLSMPVPATPKQDPLKEEGVE